MNNITIYGLIDPNTQHIKYVGKTIDTPEKRLMNHLSDKAKTHKTNWLKSLNGIIPEIIILDNCNESNWIFWEQYWISQCRTWGFKLTNTTIGGEGQSGYKPSIETREKRSNSLSGLKRTDEQRKNMSEKRKGIVFTEKHIENLSLSHIGKSPSRKAIENSAIKRFVNIIQLDENYNFIKEWINIKEAAIFYNVNQSSISHCCAGRKNKIKGFIWKYKSDYEQK